MTEHREIPIKVNALVDEGIANLVSALTKIDGLVTLESCQGDPGERDAFVVFRYGDWKQCGELLFGKILPQMSPDLRSDVSLRLQAYDTDTALGTIMLAPAAVSVLACLIDEMSAAPVSTGVFVAGHAHRKAVA